MFLNGAPVGTTPVVVPVARTAGTFEGRGRKRGGSYIELRLEREGHLSQTVRIDDEVNGWTYCNLLWPAGFVVDACSGSLTQWQQTPVMVRLEAEPAQ